MLESIVFFLYRFLFLDISSVILCGTKHPRDDQQCWCEGAAAQRRFLITVLLGTSDGEQSGQRGDNATNTAAHRGEERDQLSETKVRYSARIKTPLSHNLTLPAAGCWTFTATMCCNKQQARLKVS